MVKKTRKGDYYEKGNRFFSSIRDAVCNWRRLGSVSYTHLELMREQEESCSQLRKSMFIKKTGNGFFPHFAEKNYGVSYRTMSMNPLIFEDACRRELTGGCGRF